MKIFVQLSWNIFNISSVLYIIYKIFLEIVKIILDLKINGKYKIFEKLYI